MEKVSIVRHHWSKEQLVYFFRGGKKLHPSTPLPYKTISTIAHIVEKKYTMQKKNTLLYFNVPNYPMSLIKIDSESVSKVNKLHIHCENIIEDIEHKENQNRL